MTDTSDCLHCLINRLLDAYHERQHLETGQRVSVDGAIDDLIACTAELLAFYPDPTTRRTMARRTAELLIKRTRLFRSEGRYPGGEGSAVHEPSTLQ